MANDEKHASDALITGIAQIIDHPSVFMGGPCRNSLRIAEAIVKEFGSDLCASGRQVRALMDAAPERIARIIRENLSGVTSIDPDIRAAQNKGRQWKGVLRKCLNALKQAGAEPTASP